MTKLSALDPKVNDKTISGRENKTVIAALDIIFDNYTQKVNRDSKNIMIQQLFEEGFEVLSPSSITGGGGARKISSKVLQQAIWKDVSRTKPLDFVLNGSGRPKNVEKVVTAGVAHVMSNGGYANSLRDKAGAFFTSDLFGDSFIQIGTTENNKKTPIKFRPISNSNFYVDDHAIGMRVSNEGKSATKAVAIFSYSWPEACKLYPKLKRSGAPGEISRDTSWFKETDQTFEQAADQFYTTEVAHYYDISNKRYTVFGGAAMTVLAEYKGEKYPFVINGEPYIPVSQFMCMPSSEGFYNHGIGDMIYDLAVVSRQLLNMEIGHVEDNTYPITLVNLPQGEAGKFFNKLSLAHEMRAQGKKGYVPITYDGMSPSKVEAQSLLTNNLTAEWQIITERLDREMTRLGISLDEVDRGANVTYGQILAEEDAKNAFVKQKMEYNASETKFLVEITMDMIKKFVSKKDKTLLDMKANLFTEDGTPILADEITMGMVSQELQEHNYFTEVNSRSGVIPSGVMEQHRINKLIPFAAPGTKAHKVLMGAMASKNDFDLSGNDFMPEMQAPTGQPGEAPAPDVSGTDRLQINSRSAEAAPVL